MRSKFILPKRFTPNKNTFFGEVTRVPRKLKKSLEKSCGVHYDHLSNGQRLWYTLSIDNPEYHQFIIDQIIKQFG